MSRLARPRAPNDADELVRPQDLLGQVALPGAEAQPRRLYLPLERDDHLGAARHERVVRVSVQRRGLVDHVGYGYR